LLYAAPLPYILEIMPTKTKTATKAVKAAAKEMKPTIKKAVAKSKSSAKAAVKKVPAKAKAGRKQAEGLLETVKHGVQTGIDAVGDFVKKATPDALRPKSAKGRRK
jgi:hypothetical protein